MDIGNHNSIYPLEVSIITMAAVQLESESNNVHIDQWRSMIDTGATVTLIPTACAALLGLELMPHTDGRHVGTADQAGTLEIQGWVDLSDFVGSCSLFSGRFHHCRILSTSGKWIGYESTA